MDDLNALIAHAHRRIDQLNTELAEQRVREQIHIEAALQQQKEEHKRTLEKAVGTALQHAKEESRLEQEGKVGGIKLVSGSLARKLNSALLDLKMVPSRLLEMQKEEKGNEMKEMWKKFFWK